MGGYGEGGYGEGPYGIGGDYVPYVAEKTLDKFPHLLPRGDSTFAKYIRAHDEKFTAFDEDIIDVILSRQINNAKGTNLDRIGQIFGELGRRRGRSDTDYRNNLRSIVESFKGRGTKPGIKFALSGAVNTTPDEILIEEHFDTLENTVTITEWEAHNNDTIVTLFNLAKPSVVQLRYPIEYQAGKGTITMTGSTRAGNEDLGLGSGNIGDNHIGFYESN